MAKNVQNPAQFLTTFDYDREFLWNGSTNRKSEKYFIIYDPSYVGRKKVGELWSTNNGVMCPPIFIRAKDCIRLANAHPNWDAPPKKNYDDILKYGLKFRVV